METIKLSKTQALGYALLVQSTEELTRQVQQRQQVVKDFLTEALRENGGNPAEDWQYNPVDAMFYKVEVPSVTPPRGEFPREA